MAISPQTIRDKRLESFKGKVDQLEKQIDELLNIHFNDAVVTVQHPLLGHNYVYQEIKKRYQASGWVVRRSAVYPLDALMFSPSE